MKVRFTNARMERSNVRGPYDILLGVVADFEVLTGGRTLYQDEMMPIVELASALRDWLTSGLPKREDFEFQSLESDESGALWIRFDGDGWRIGSIYQEYADLTLRADGVVDVPLREFITSVDEWLYVNFELTLDAVTH